MSTTFKWIIFIIILAGAGAILYYYKDELNISERIRNFRISNKNPIPDVVPKELIYPDYKSLAVNDQRGSIGEIKIDFTTQSTIKDAINYYNQALINEGWLVSRTVEENNDVLNATRSGDSAKITLMRRVEDTRIILILTLANF